jgi:multimeric flavodoxin WrbA
MTKVLGIAGSLRNARFTKGGEKLISEIKSIESKGDLIRYLEEQTKQRFEDFLSAGRKDNLDFEAIYKNLQKAKADRGLSNSEAGLAAGLWGAFHDGADISYASLSTYFPASGKGRDLDDLRTRVLEADALLVSGPVYFGDRSSLCQEFIEFLRNDPELHAHVQGKLFGGIAAGAKRNGGQETTLIYQLIDAANLGMLGVGNDSETTSQYGGTVVAGDVGTMHQDHYGIMTSLGTGRRLSRVGRLLESAKSHRLKDRVRVHVWLLQDSADHRGRDYMERWAERVMAAEPQTEIIIKDFTQEEVYRCIACDICPTDPGDVDDYRCIVKAGQDTLVRHHKELVGADAILLGAYSPVDRSDVHSIYQRFIERTRYLRRDDYALGDRLTAPFVISEVNSGQNMHIRMLTSMVRHHTVLHHPLIGFEHEGKLLNDDALLLHGINFARTATRLSIGRLLSAEDEQGRRRYHPEGYKVSLEKVSQDQTSGQVSAADALRQSKFQEARHRRIAQKGEAL